MRLKILNKSPCGKKLLLTTNHEQFATNDQRFKNTFPVNNTMNFKIYSRKFALFAIFLISFALTASAQTMNFPVPRDEKLLNGLRLLAWNDPQAATATVKLRVHSGAAFDLQGREGTMHLLSQILFPSDAAREFFTEDLNGSFEVVSNYDYIQINLTGDNDKLLEMLESLANAVQNAPVDKDTTATVKTAHLAKLQELEKNPAYIADLAARKRLLGNFPYGRPAFGTTESVGKIDFADILLAKQKYLTSDNATLTVSGNVKPELVFRAAKRYFGSWLKADKKIPSTFTQPDLPKSELLITNSPFVEKSEVRYALRGLARNDKDFIASQILTKILQFRLLATVPNEHRKDTSISQSANFLPSLIVICFSKMDQPKNSLAEEEKGFRKLIFDSLFSQRISNEDFNIAKSAILAEMNQKNLADWWLDAHTFKIISVKDEMLKANNVTLEDVQKVADNLQKQPVASIVVLKSEEEKK